MTPTTEPILVDEHAAAKALGMSVFWLRRDRRTDCQIPVVRLNTAVRYDLESVRRAVANMQAPTGATA